MEIRIIERLMGRELRDRILARWRSRGALEKAARRPDAYDAKAALAHLAVLEEAPHQLDQEMTVTTVGVLGPGEVRMLTGIRLELLETVLHAQGGINVTGLAAHVGRDKKNVSEDLKFLARIGLVRMDRRGREAFPHATGAEIRIITAPREPGARDIATARA